VRISLQELKDLSKRALSKYGYPEDEAMIILDMLMYAQTRGNDQGIVKLIGNGIPRHPKAQTPTIEKETETTAIRPGVLRKNETRSMCRHTMIRPWSAGKGRAGTRSPSNFPI